MLTFFYFTPAIISVMLFTNYKAFRAIAMINDINHTRSMKHY